MKVVVISDSHGNIANLKHVLGFAQKINTAAIIHCGDWDDLAAVHTVAASGIPVYAVLGNADIHGDVAENLKLKAQGFSEGYLGINFGGKKIGIIHNIRLLDSSTAGQRDILFCGHWHQQKETVLNGVKVVNPGPLENDIFFAVYDTEADKVDLVKI